MASSVRVRFAPSPTGFLHLGGLRTALFNYVFARKHGGTFVLRIEDTDQRRLVPGAVEAIQQTLAWAGIKVDEGPVLQSTRLPLYAEHARKLLASGAAYPCFCTEDRLALVRDLASREGRVTAYDGACRHLTAEQRDALLAAKQPFTVRLRVPREGVTTVQDKVCGQVQFENRGIDDQVLCKTNGWPTYHLANVVDDHLMGITHVIRGDEWLSSTPKHLLLYEAFGWTPPQYAHIPLLVNKDRSKLSKRQNDLHVEELARSGVLPSALTNFLVFLGWTSPNDQTEIYPTLESISADFSLEKIGNNPAVVDTQKLYFLDKRHQLLQNAGSPSLAQVIAQLLPQVKDRRIPRAGMTAEAYLEQVLLSCRGTYPTLGAVIQQCPYFWTAPQFDTPAATELLYTHLQAGSGNAACALLMGRLGGLHEFTLTEVSTVLSDMARDMNTKPAALFKAIRVALSGHDHGPSLPGLIVTLGGPEVMRRLASAVTRTTMPAIPPRRLK